MLKGVGGYEWSFHHGLDTGPPCAVDHGATECPGLTTSLQTDGWQGLQSASPATADEHSSSELVTVLFSFLLVFLLFRALLFYGLYRSLDFVSFLFAFCICLCTR